MRKKGGDGRQGLHRYPIVKLIKVILTKLPQKHHSRRYSGYDTDEVQRFSGFPPARE